MIKFEKVSFRYPKAGRDALAGVTLEIPEGSFFALLGPNGAGKTTLLRLLCGRFPQVAVSATFQPSANVTSADATSVGAKADATCFEKPRWSGFSGLLEIDPRFKNADGFLDAKSYGVLLENPGVYPKLSIEEYLSYFAGFYGMGEGACLAGGSLRKRTEMLADRLQLPALNARLSTLSLGNRQKVQIARALMHRPKILILDEPVANLDPNAREVVWKLIAEWRREEGGTAIVCSHILAEMESEATDYAIIDSGCVVAAGVVPKDAAAVRKSRDAMIARAIPENASSDPSLSPQCFLLNVPGGTTPDQIRQALVAEGIEASVTPCQRTLADIYKSVTQI